MSKGIDKEAAIRTHYTELNKFGQNGEYEKAIKTANKSESNSHPDIIQQILNSKLLFQYSPWIRTNSKRLTARWSA